MENKVYTVFDTSNGFGNIPVFTGTLEQIHNWTFKKTLEQAYYASQNKQGLNHD